MQTTRMQLEQPGRQPATALRNAGAGGFTLLELTVVMGILAGFLVMLVQLLDGGLRLFGDGELAQALADRQSNVQRVLSSELQTLRGSGRSYGSGPVDDRLLVQWLPIGVPLRPETNATHVQVLRAAVHLPPERELPLLEAFVAARLLQESPNLEGAELEAAVATAVASEPLRGVGNMILLPWRQTGKDPALLELRAGWLLPGQLVPLERDEWIDPFAVPVPGSPELSSFLLDRLTAPLLRDLLHLEFQFWSQNTTRWRPANTLTNTATPALDLPSGSGHAERIWDSTRGGLLTAAQNGGTWAYDRGPQSLNDPSDDIHPHAIRVFAVVAQPAELAAEGLLASPLDADDDQLELVQGDRFPGPNSGGFVKVGAEWIRYAERNGDRLLGLRRGQRATKRLQHAAGTRVHYGRSVEFTVPLPHAKDDWNG